MLDIKFIRENSDKVKENIKKKFQDEKVKKVDGLLKKDEKYPDEIRKTLLQNLAPMRACYKEQLKNGGNEFTLTVKVSFTINRKGQAEDAKAEPLNPDDERKKKVCDCISAIVSKMIFPKPENRVAVSQSFQFRPENFK